MKAKDALSRCRISYRSSVTDTFITRFVYRNNHKGMRKYPLKISRQPLPETSAVHRIRAIRDIRVESPVFSSQILGVRTGIRPFRCIRVETYSSDSAIPWFIRSVVCCVRVIRHDAWFISRNRADLSTRTCSRRPLPFPPAIGNLRWWNKSYSIDLSWIENRSCSSEWRLETRDSSVKTLNGSFSSDFVSSSSSHRSSFYLRKTVESSHR